MEQHAVDFLLACEPRLLAAVFPPHSDRRQPLTLAALQETERVLFLLTHAARCKGAWQLAMPQSLAAFRCNVAAWVEFAARPALEAQCTAHCPPQVRKQYLLMPALLFRLSTLCHAARCYTYTLHGALPAADVGAACPVLLRCC